MLLLTLLVAGCSCADGDSDSAFGPDCCCDEVDDGTPDGDPATGTGTLIFSDVASSSIRRFQDTANIESAVVTSPPVTGATTRLTRPQFLTIHPTNNELIVPDEGTVAILFFADPLSINGDAPPIRVLTGPATELVAPVQTYVDPETDELYVLDRGGSRILVFAAASTAEGDVAPTRRIGGPVSGIQNPASFIVNSATNQLTVINPTEILTFTDYRTVNGDVDPAGRVNGTATTFQNLSYGLFDSANSLILVDRGTRSIIRFENFDFDQSNQAPTRVISGGNTRITEPAQFVLTSDDTMYLANAGEVLVFESVNTLEGNPFPDRYFSALDPVSQTIRGLLAP